MVIAASLERVARREHSAVYEVVEAKASGGDLSIVGVRMGPPKVLGPPNPTSSISTMTTLGALLGAFTSKRAGGLAFIEFGIGLRSLAPRGAAPCDRSRPARSAGAAGCAGGAVLHAATPTSSAMPRAMRMPGVLIMSLT